MQQDYLSKSDKEHLPRGKLVTLLLSFGADISSIAYWDGSIEKNTPASSDNTRYSRA